MISRLTFMAHAELVARTPLYQIEDYELLSLSTDDFGGLEFPLRTDTDRT